MGQTNLISLSFSKITTAQCFMLIMLIVNGGNYLYNLALGQLLGPESFAHAAFLITSLLSISFIAMTFQLVVATFYKQLLATERKVFLQKWSRIAFGIGLLLSIIILIGSESIQRQFHLDSKTALVVFSIGIPFYFLFNVQRGKLQAEESFIQLGINYLVEMVMRFAVTLVLIFVLPDASTLAVSIGVLASIIASTYIVSPDIAFETVKSSIRPELLSKIKVFIIVTLCYELTLNLISSADILIVKHNFDNTEAGLYASIALIGRMVYYITWMYAMVMLPQIIRRRESNQESRSLLHSTLYQVGFISCLIIGICLLFPKLIVTILFGKAFLSGAHLLGLYALATGIFSISNIFCYAYLSLSKYTPVIIAAVVAVIQLIALCLATEELSHTIWIQVICMSVLLISQLVYHYNHKQLFLPKEINYSSTAILNLPKT